MGKAHSRPQTEREPLREGHDITFPVNVECRARPSLNRRFDVTVRYSVETVLFDVLKQIERRITSSGQPRDDRVGGKLVISAVSKRSFLRHRIDLNDSTENRTRLRALQYRSITSYTEKAIRREGVHCEVQTDRVPLRAIDGSKGLRVRSALNSARNRPSSSSSNSNSTKPKGSRSGSECLSTTKQLVALQRRLETLKRTEDAAFVHFDEMQSDHALRDQARLKMLRRKESGNGELVAFGEADWKTDSEAGSVWGGLPWRLRDVLLDWFYDLQCDLNLHDETIFAALNYIDLHLVRRQMKQLDLQLLGVTACCLASKTYEIIPQPMSEWLYLSHDQYSRSQMIALERQLLQSINWTVFQVTPISFAMPWLHLLGLEKANESNKSKSKNAFGAKGRNDENSNPQNKGNSSDHGLAQRVLIDLLLRAGAMTSAFMASPSAVVAAAAIALSFLYLRRDDGAHSKWNIKNIPKTKPSENRWTMSSEQEQAPKIAMLAAASKLDLRGEAVSTMMAAIDQRVCRLLAENTKNPSLSALYKLSTGAIEVEKRYGPKARALDIRTLDIPKRSRPLKL